MLLALASAWTLRDTKVVVSTFDEDVAWLVPFNASGADLKVYNHVGPPQEGWSSGAEHGRSHCFPSCAPKPEAHEAGIAALKQAGVEVVSVPNVGDEAAVVLMHLVENYDKLAPVQVFLHGHQASWHQNFDIGERLKGLTYAKGFAYANLNDEAAPRCFNMFTPHIDPDGANMVGSLQALWPLLMEGPMSMERPGWCSFCCAQFAVEADAIRRHPKAYYEKLLSHFQASPGDWKQLEHFWFLIFDPGQALLDAPALASVDLAAYMAAAEGLNGLLPKLPVSALVVVALGLAAVGLAARLPQGKKGRELKACGAGETTPLWKVDLAHDDLL